MKGTTMHISTSTTSLDEQLIIPTSRRGEPKHKHLIAIILLILAAVLGFTSMAGVILYEHSQVTQAKAALKQTVVERDKARTERDDATSQVSDLQSDNADLQDTIDKCSVWAPIAGHNAKALKYMSNAIRGGDWGSIIWLPRATAEVKKATALLDANQSYDGELYHLCKPAAGQGI